jgi:hypothetical protein
MTLPLPTTKIRLAKDGPDAYLATLDHPLRDLRPADSIRVEREGNEWVRTDLSRPVWFPTLQAFRDAVASTNVCRWVNHARTRHATTDSVQAARDFRAWVRARHPACPGTRRAIADFGWTSHNGCCDPTFGVALPDGVTALTLYREWAAGMARASLALLEAQGVIR